MAKPQHVNNAKAIVALLVLAIAFVIFFKFWTNQNAFLDDPNALKNYVIFAIVGGGFLIGLLSYQQYQTHSCCQSFQILQIQEEKEIEL